jgi:signal transduction histidine kinase
VLRLAQEGLTNVAKHAGPAARVRLCAELVDGGVRVEVRDHGDESGAGTWLGRSGLGLGMVGMRERVELLGGTLRAGPEGAGWCLSALLPAGDSPQKSRPVGSLW